MARVSGRDEQKRGTARSVEMLWLRGALTKKDRGHQLADAGARPSARKAGGDVTCLPSSHRIAERCLATRAAQPPADVRRALRCAAEIIRSPVPIPRASRMTRVRVAASAVAAAVLAASANAQTGSWCDAAPTRRNAPPGMILNHARSAGAERRPPR